MGSRLPERCPGISAASVNASVLAHWLRFPHRCRPADALSIAPSLHIIKHDVATSGNTGRTRVCALDQIEMVLLTKAFHKKCMRQNSRLYDAHQAPRQCSGPNVIKRSYRQKSLYWQEGRKVVATKIFPVKRVSWYETYGIWQPMGSSLLGVQVVFYQVSRIEKSTLLGTACVSAGTPKRTQSDIQGSPQT